LRIQAEKENIWKKRLKYGTDLHIKRIFFRLTEQVYMLEKSFLFDFDL